MRYRETDAGVGSWSRGPQEGSEVDVPLSPPRGMKVHAIYGDVAPRCGGMNIISGSHRLVHRWFVEHPPTPGAKAAALRKSLHRIYTSAPHAGRLRLVLCH
jgi:hypothetical protein